MVPPLLVLFPGWVGHSSPAHDDDVWGCVGTSVVMIGHTSPLSRQLKLFDAACSGEVSTANNKMLISICTTNACCFLMDF